MIVEIDSITGLSLACADDACEYDPRMAPERRENPADNLNVHVYGDHSDDRDDVAEGLVLH